MPVGEEPAGTVIGVAKGGQLLGWFEISDPLRPTTPAAVAALRDLGLRTVMLTGDPKGVQAEVTFEVVLERL